MRMMHIGFDEASNTPLKIVMRHMEYKDLEDQKKAQSQQNA